MLRTFLYFYQYDEALNATERHDTRKESKAGIGFEQKAE
jgi:hypothetical protein